MALTQIADVIDVTSFGPYVVDLSVSLSLLVRSGVIVSDAQQDSFLAGPGKLIQLPFWDDLDDTEANISGDAKPDAFNPVGGDLDAIPLNVGSGEQIAMRNNRNQVWAVADLAGALAGEDPMTHIANRIAAYWVRQEQLMLNSVLVGLVQAETSLINDIAAAGGVDATAGTSFSSNELLNTFQLMGDHKSNIRAIAVHSAIHTEMQKNNLISFIPESEGNVGFGTFMGKTLLVDDGLTTDVRAGATVSHTVYDTVCFGPGAFARGNGSPKHSTELSREALAGNGGGVESLINRQEFTLHPKGFAVKVTLGAGESPTNVEYEAADAYSMVVADRKSVPIAVLRSDSAAA